MFIQDNGAWINIDIACQLLGLSRSCYYEWSGNYDKYLEKRRHEEQLTQSIIEAFHKFKSRYGARRVTEKLNCNNIKCSYDKVSKIMRDNKLHVLGYKRFKVTTTNSNHKYKVFDNLLERNFAVAAPNQAFVGDITYIRTNEGWLYLATVIDLFSRKVIGYKMSNRMTKDLVISALLMALKARNFPKNVIVHSDRGSQYASKAYKHVLAMYGLRGSMSKKGDCWDNAVAESFFATLKKEYVHQTMFKTRLDAQFGIFDYIETWYNEERIHSTLGWLSPNEFEEFYAKNAIVINERGNAKQLIKSGVIGVSKNF